MRKKPIFGRARQEQIRRVCDALKDDQQKAQRACAAIGAGHAYEESFDTKASSRKTPSPFICAGWNLYSLRKNPRFYMSLFLGFLLCWLLTDKTMAISRTYLTNVQIVEPFVWCYADGNSILYAALVMMLMLSAFPRIDTPASYLIFRTTRLNWLIGQIITVFVLTFGYRAGRNG